MTSISKKNIRKLPKLDDYSKFLQSMGSSDISVKKITTSKSPISVNQKRNQSVFSPSLTSPLTLSRLEEDREEINNYFDKTKKNIDDNSQMNLRKSEEKNNKNIEDQQKSDTEVNNKHEKENGIKEKDLRENEIGNKEEKDSNLDVEDVDENEKNKEFTNFHIGTVNEENDDALNQVEIRKNMEMDEVDKNKENNKETNEEVQEINERNQEKLEDTEEYKVGDEEIENQTIEPNLE